MTEPATPPVLTPPLSDAEKADVEALFKQFKDEAKFEARKYILVRTPPRLQEAMLEKVDADFPAPEPVAPPPAAAAPAPPPAQTF